MVHQMCSVALDLLIRSHGAEYDLGKTLRHNLK